jgi:hypothetical protein
MNRTIDVRVFQQAHFPDTAVTEVAQAVRHRFGSTVHLLNRGQAIAVIWTGVPTPKGAFRENLDNMAKVSPIACFVDTFLPSREPLKERWDPIAMWLPVHKYDIDLWLPPGETNGRFIQTGFTKPYCAESRLIYSLVWRRPPKAEVREQARPIIESWHKEAVEAGFGEEKMLPTKLNFIPKENELVFKIPEYTPVTFPWIELYLRLRTEMPRKSWPNGMMYTPI